MKIVALVRPAGEVPEAAQVLAAASGMAPAEARMRLAPEPPALLARLAPDAADALVKTLQDAGLAVLAIDEAETVERVTARTVTFGSAQGTFTPRSGEPLTMAWEDVTVILRGASSMRTQSEHTEKKTQVALGAALITGGLKMTKTTETSVRGSQEETSQVVFVFDRDGRGAVLPEIGLDFSCLGPAMQPSRTANMVALPKLLRERAPKAFYDERLLRLGRRPLPFVLGGAVQIVSGTTSHSRINTAQGLDVLAEAMRQGVARGYLP
ncbi:hypothetical protein OV208_21735 [Corallococcus sp. bb12-1]|uniref:hypothetical protein n=1 Tax=Corallococcus sp. bb12-1 TaxID=2996784 RepID=UPI00226F5130|nr:hypothetical protein [Corallococcus sp. bb12-1]MCY1043952.1 hypothetical protein [Corallococcus sp. bb12-1]